MQIIIKRLKAIVPSVVSAVAGNQCRFCGGILINARCIACRSLSGSHFRHAGNDARQLDRQAIAFGNQRSDALVTA